MCMCVRVCVSHTSVVITVRELFTQTLERGNNEARSTRYRWLADKVIYLFK